ncbi:MAG: hypothetical protein KAJ39_08585 [Gammaproteobacteria bacterium]|nr:hypothetical protein [Gammaproteobacteria bacterium]
MAVFDIEAFRDYYLDLFKANLNTKIQAINVEKADDITLDEFIDGQFVTDMNEKVLNRGSYVIINVEGVDVNNNGHGTFSSEITISFSVIFTKISGGSKAETMLFRYMRALEEVVRDTMGKNSYIGNEEILLFLPNTMQDNLNSSYVKVAGVLIKGTIA